MKRLFKTIFGVLALVMGTGIMGWFVYNQFAPTALFKESYHSIFQLGLPLAMIWVGARWLTGRSRAGSHRYAHFVYAKILDPIGPMERGRKYADPLHEALRERDLGEVSGGGVVWTKAGQVEWVGLDLELANLQGALEFTRQRLRELGAPPGSFLEYLESGKDIELPI